MDISCVSARADDNSTEVFSSSVPLKPETYDTIDSLNVTNIVTAIESLDTKTSIIDFTTRTDSGTINVHKVDVKEHLHNDKDPRRNEIVKEADCEKPQNTTVFDAGLQISNDSLEETKISIDLDFTETKNTVFIDEKKVCIVETEGTIDFDEAGTGNVIVLDEDKTDTDLIILDCEKSQNTIVIEAGAKTSNDMLEETKIAIDLDGTETKNTEIYEKKDAGVLETEDTIDLDEAEADKIIIDTDVIVLDGSRTNSDVIVLDGKRSDSDVIVLDGNKTDSESTIILDDDEINKFTKRLPGPNDSVIDVENDTDYSKVAASSAAKDKKKKNEYSDLYKENSLLTELIEKCLDMENTEGMSRVINRTVLVIYKNVDESYKKSDAFRKVITNTIMKLDVQPERKFSHLRYLCDELKKHKAKKRVPFITLEEGTDKEQSTSCIPPKRRKVDVIDLDDETRNDIIQQNNPNQATKHKKDYPIGKVYPPIEINDDDSSSDVLLADGDDDVILLDENKSNKENTKKAKKYKKKYKKYKQRKLLGLEKKRGRPSNRDLSIGNQNVASNIISQNNINTNLDGYSISDPGALLEPRLSVAMLPESNATSKIISQHNITNTELVNDVSNPGVLLESRTSVEMLRKLNQVRINDIETQIAYFKKRVEELEEAEVFTDNQQSPYVMCEHFKSLILNLYKELCQLTGTEVTKRHEVRLQVVPGHPEGPVRCLEEFLNANIDEDGNPPFPDMHDVIGCVYEANLKYKMHWTRSHILSEAQALFTQFGRSMQKRRQKREWKDLMSLVKQEVPDPADEDPVLQARLMENTRIARRNEQKLLERFANMEHTHDPAELRLSMNQSAESEEYSDEDTSHAGDLFVTHTGPPLSGITTEMGPQKSASGLTMGTDFGPQNTASGSVDLGLPQALQNTLDPIMLSGAVSSVVSSDNGKAVVGTIGSLVTISGGKIVIQPTIKYDVAANENLPNINKPRAAYSNETTFYSSEFNKFILNLYNKPSLHEKKTAENDRKNNLAKSSNLAKNSSAQGTLNNNDNNLANAANNKSAQRTLNNNDNNLTNTACLANAENVAKEILSLVQSDCSKTNSLAKETLQPTTDQLTNLNEVSKADNLYAKCSTNNTLKAKISNSESNQNGHAGFQIFTHTSKLERDLIIDRVQDIKETAYKELNTTEETIGKDRNVLEVANQISDDAIENVDSIKPEPLDIPSMLEELGEGFTATVYDIEDPFLVIEISDSSESEDEDL